jgi:PTS system mannose-specific IIC component
MELLWVSLLGGVLALDATSAGQFMVSRPLVSGALAGWVFGDATTGLVVGALLELYLLVSFPSGGARFPEGATATVVAVAAAAAGGPGAIPIGVAIGLVWGQVGGASISLLRKLNGRLVPAPDTARPERVVATHVGALALDFARGTLVTFAGALAGRWVVAVLSGAWPLDPEDSLGLLLVGGAVSGGILLRSLGGFRRRRVLFAVGLLLGLVGARFL